MGRIKKFRSKWYRVGEISVGLRPAVPCCKRKKDQAYDHPIVRFKIRGDGSTAYCPKCMREYIIERDPNEISRYRFVSRDPAPSKRQWFCPKCQKFHRIGSKISLDHGGDSRNPEKLRKWGGKQ